MRAIVLNATRYADDSFMVSLFTEEAGTLTVSVKTGRKSRVRMSHIQPLTLLQVTLGGRPSQAVKQIEECAFGERCGTIDSPAKMMTAQFLAETLTHILRNTPQDGRLFEFVYRSIAQFVQTERGEANFHLFFLIKLTYFLGIYPNTETWAEGSHFDLSSGEFVERAPMHGYSLTASDSIDFANMLRTSYGNMHCWHLSRNDRNNILNHIIDYYRIHAIDFSSIRSLDILRIL